ncbi:hypothetical protein RJ639_030243 [Escallonia herrerae]|uniref:Serine carboxypeptidase-like 45 n=1 Tax=Escallonia herrerae TaxID=1293975 RepID=A0AA89BAZ6_9ASTE|nr:hypothetical protein RJ639_030243 [Escallonia herrerae]
MASWSWGATLLVFLCFSACGGELITKLPGQPKNVGFKQYSGYTVTDAGHGRALFYYFVEADSADPLSRPLTVWFNGGPGCSSFGVGAFMENGPFQVGENGKLLRNEFSWNLESNMLPLQYQQDNLDMNIIPLVLDILKEGIPILLFSGDQDSLIPLTQTRTIANILAEDAKLLTLNKYGPWYDGKQVGGWSQSFGEERDGKNVTSLTYATVRGAAHEVPFSSPSQALTLFLSFLKGSALPRPHA